jgi:hypothetical protein
MEFVTSLLLIAVIGILGVVAIVKGIKGSVKIWREDKNGIHD